MCPSPAMPDNRQSGEAAALLSSSTHCTDRFLFLFGAVQLFGSLALLFPALLLIYLVLMAGLILAALLSWHTLVRPSAFSVKCHVLGKLELESSCTCRVTVSVSKPPWPRADLLKVLTPSLRTLSFTQTFGAFKISHEQGQGASFYVADLEAGAYRLGYEQISEITLLATAVFGFFLRSIKLKPQSLPFRIMPRLEHLSAEEWRRLTKNQRLLYQGTRQVMRGRGTDQFLTVRNYEYPDPLRLIDARKSAKFDTLMTRVYDNFFNHHLVLALDLGRAMCGTIGTSSKQDFYLSAALNMARHAFENHDQVSFIAFAQKPELILTRARTPGAFDPIYRGAALLAPREQETNFFSLHQALASVAPTRAVVIVLSDVSRPSVQESLSVALAPIAARHLVAVVSLLEEANNLESQILHCDLGNLSVQTHANLLYSYWLNARLEVLRLELSRFGSGVLTVSDKYWLSSIAQLYRLLRSSLAAG